MIGEPDV